MKKKITSQDLPDIDALRAELKREKYKNRYLNVLRSTIFTLVVVAAIAVLIAVLWMPVLRIYGSSMTPTLSEGEIVLSVKGTKFEKGDLVAFYVGNKLLVKRYIASQGEWVEIKENGDVLINNNRLSEPYITEKALGDCDIEMPYQVPDGRYFMMGDHRATSIDSRNTTVGCIADEEVVGKIVFRIWPLSKFGAIH